MNQQRTSRAIEAELFDETDCMVAVLSEAALLIVNLLGLLLTELELGSIFEVHDGFYEVRYER